MVALGLFACVVFTFALLSRRVEGTILTAPMVFVSAGLVASWTGLVNFGEAAHGDPVAGEISREVVLLVASSPSCSWCSRTLPGSIRGRCAGTPFRCACSGSACP